jgi:tetratricopeptide (TPR) repeat protein
MASKFNTQQKDDFTAKISRLFSRNVALLGLTTILINPIAASYAQSSVIQPNTVETYIAQGSAADYLKRGNERLNEGDNQGAIADFTQALRLNPNDIDIYYSRGLAYLYLGNCQEAMADFNQTLSLNPEYAEAYINRGIAFAGLRDYPKAITDFNQAIKRKPSFAIAYINRAIARRNSGDSQGYYEDYQKAAEIMATGTTDYNYAPVYLVHYTEPLNLDRASSPIPDDITVWFTIHQEISQGIHFAAAGTEGIKPPPLSYPDPFQKPWLESLMVKYKSKQPVWLNTLIEQYSEWTEKNPGKKFEEVSIIHLGINEGRNEAMRIAKDYSEAWGHPVFVVETFPPLLFGELTESSGGWASRFPFHLSLVIPAWFSENSSYDLAGVSQFLREQGHTVKREVFWSGSVVLLGNRSEFSQFSAKTHSGVKIITRGGTLDPEAVEYFKNEGIQLDLYQPPPNKKPDFVAWITDRNKTSQFDMYLSSEMARSLTPFAREIGRISLNSLDVLVNIPLKELLIYGDHNLYKQLPLDQNLGLSIGELQWPSRFLTSPTANINKPQSLESSATSFKLYVGNEITGLLYPKYTLADNQSLLQFSTELVLKSGFLSTTTPAVLGDFIVGSIPIGENTPRQEVAVTLAWLFVPGMQVAGRGSKIPRFISKIDEFIDIIELSEAVNDSDFGTATLRLASLVYGFKGNERLSGIFDIKAEFSELSNKLTNSDTLVRPPDYVSSSISPVSESSNPEANGNSQVVSRPDISPDDDSKIPPNNNPPPGGVAGSDQNPLIARRDGNLENQGYNLDKKGEQLLLQGNWQELKNHLQTDSQPVTALLTGHAKLATNENNDSLLSFIAVSKDRETLQKWEKWTENFLKLHQDSSIAYYLAGDAKARLGKIDEAIADFTEAIALDPNFALAYNARGVLYALKQDWNNANNDLLAATELDSDLADAQANFGTIGVLKGAIISEGRAALDAFDRALEINPDFALAYNNRGSLYLGNNELEEAESDFGKAKNKAKEFSLSLIDDLATENQKIADATNLPDPHNLPSHRQQTRLGGIDTSGLENIHIDRGDWKVKTCFGLFYQVSIVRETSN